MKCHACIKNAISTAFVTDHAIAVDVQQHIYIVTANRTNGLIRAFQNSKQGACVFLRLFELYKHWFECCNRQGYKLLYFCIVNGTESTGKYGLADVRMN